MNFNRDLYYSQSEACKEFKLSIKRFKQLLIENDIPVIERKITLHTSPEGLPYHVISNYVGKADLMKIISINGS